mgnify:CR=1 FL=1
MSIIKNRLIKNNKRLRKYFAKINSNAYRIYHHDIPEYPYIIEKYNKSNVQNIIKKNDEYIKKQKNENKILDNKKIVKFKNGNFRSFDLYTGFQSGHISQRKAGQWRDMFSKEEISTIIKQLDEIATELGYPSEKE